MCILGALRAGSVAGLLFGSESPATLHSATEDPKRRPGGAGSSLWVRKTRHSVAAIRYAAEIGTPGGETPADGAAAPARKTFTAPKSALAPVAMFFLTPT